MFTGLESLEPRTLLSSGSLSPAEMEIVWRVNQARSNPAKYAKLNKMPAAVKSIARQQPLAVNANLGKAAQFRAGEMAKFNYFAHTSAVTGKQPNEIARDNGYALDNSMPNNSNSIESIFGGFPASPQRAVNTLIEDKGVNPPGHRIHLLATNPFFQNHKEIGAGFKTNNNATLKNYVSILTGFRDTNHVFLTGVAYNDKNGNKRFDAGEGIRGLSVQVDGVTVTKTGRAGGYSVLTTAGAHSVKLLGAKAPTKNAAAVNVGASNIAIDFVGNAKKPVQINFAGTNFRPTATAGAVQAGSREAVAIAASHGGAGTMKLTVRSLHGYVADRVLQASA
jgi:uncharacterized protein YkwD